MFEITKPSSTTSNFSTSLSATKPPKSDSGVIRGQPSLETYNLFQTISNVGNDEWVQNVEVIINSIIPLTGPELILVTKDAFIEDLGPNASQEVGFQLSLQNPENTPQAGDRYQINGVIKFNQEGLEGQQEHGINVSVDVQILE